MHGFLVRAGLFRDGLLLYSGDTPTFSVRPNDDCFVLLLLLSLGRAESKSETESISVKSSERRKSIYSIGSTGGGW